MEVFINECSLEGQYANNNIFHDSIRLFVKSIQCLIKIDTEKQVLKSNYFFDYRGFRGSHLGTSLKSNPSINLLFNSNFEKINPKIWNLNKIHDEKSSYVFNKINYVTKSVAEIAERKNTINEYKGFLLNFNDSSFSNEISINVVKNKGETILVDCAHDPNSVYNWLLKNEYIKPSEEYDESSQISPADSQTILNDSNLFELTTYPKNKNRKVYRKIGTTQLWTVDGWNKHAGKKAHIEVFDEISRKHLGTSLYNEDNLNIKHLKKNRTINLG